MYAVIPCDMNFVCSLTSLYAKNTHMSNKIFQFRITEKVYICFNSVKHSQTILNYEKHMFINNKDRYNLPMTHENAKKIKEKNVIYYCVPTLEADKCSYWR